MFLYPVRRERPVAVFAGHERVDLRVRDHEVGIPVVIVLSALV